MGKIFLPAFLNILVSCACVFVVWSSSYVRHGVRIIVSSINLILKRVYLEIMVLYLNSGGVRLYVGAVLHVYFISWGFLELS